MTLQSLLLSNLNYNAWANERIYSLLSELSQEELNRELNSSFKTVRKTFAHIGAAMQVWLTRLHGDSPVSLALQEADIPFPELYETMKQLNDDLIAFTHSKSDEDLKKEILYVNISGKSFSNITSDILLHTVNHSTYHRGQITTMLRELGKTRLLSTDYIAFMR